MGETDGVRTIVNSRELCVLDGKAEILFSGKLVL